MKQKSQPSFTVNQKKRSLFNFLIGLLLLCASPTFHAALPDLGSRPQQKLSFQQQQTLRTAFLRTLYQSHRINTDPTLNQWLSDLGHRLAQYADLPQRPVFLLINSPEINAFAGPGGVIGVHTGLILAADTTDEVAAVLAHELAHVQQHHLLRTIEDTRYSNLTALASILAALLVGQYNDQASVAALYTGQALSAQQQLAFSRHHETEADALGIQILADAGYDPLAMARFFDKLAQQNRSSSLPIPEILRTHPVSKRRLADALNRAERLIHTPHTSHTDDYLPYIQALLGAPLPPDKTDPCLQCLNTSNCPNTCLTNNWLNALHYALTQPDPASSLNDLIQHWPRNSALRLAAARLAATPQQAIDHLSNWQAYPVPLRTLMLERLAELQQRIHRDDASKLYAALVAQNKGYVKQQHALVQEINPARLTPSERLIYRSLKSKKRQTKSPRPK